MRWLTVDCEACAGEQGLATDPYRARIVQLALLVVEDGEVVERRCRLINPGRPIDEDSAAVHGITDDLVRDEPTFAAYAKAIQSLVESVDALASGYNSRRYDVPLLHTELRRAGQPGFPVDDMQAIQVAEVDPYLVWVAREPRTLAAAMARFCDEPDYEAEAHDALADAEAVVRLVPAMCEAWGLSLDEMAELSKPDWELDRAGAFKRDGNTVRFGIGKHRDELAIDHPGFLDWMLDARRDFAPDTRAWAQRLLVEARHTERLRQQGQGSASWHCTVCDWRGHTDQLGTTPVGGLACPECSSQSGLVPAAGESPAAAVK